MQTMGINYALMLKKLEIIKHIMYNTENGLRIENGLNLRVSYFYAQ